MDWVGDGQVLKMLREEKGPPLDDQDVGDGPGVENALRKSELTESTANDDVVDLSRFAGGLPVRLGQKEDMIHDFLGRGGTGGRESGIRWQSSGRRTHCPWGAEILTVEGGGVDRIGAMLWGLGRSSRGGL